MPPRITFNLNKSGQLEIWLGYAPWLDLQALSSSAQESNSRLPLRVKSGPDGPAT